MGSKLNAVHALMGSILAGVVGCSSSGLVLETKQGEPPPSMDGGAPAAPDAAAPPDGAVEGVGGVDFRSGSIVKVTGDFVGNTLLGVNAAHDATHDVDCQIALAEDGKERCLPIPGGQYYSDANCTDLILVEPPTSGSCASPLTQVVSYQAGAACPPPAVHVATRGASITRPETLYAWAAGACQTTVNDSSGLPGVKNNYFETVAASASDWVAYTRTVTPVTKSLEMEVWHGDDGSVLDGSMLLSSGDTPCDPVAPNSSSDFPQGTKYCAPTARDFEDTNVLWADSACTDAPTTLAPSCTHPQMIVVPGTQSSTGCESNDYYAVGPAVPNASVYTAVLGPCRIADSLLAGTTSYRRGARVDIAATYPEMKVVAQGTDAVQALVWQSETTAFGVWPPTPHVMAVDVATGAQCTERPFEDGTVRCVPPYDFTDFFADAACSIPLVSVAVSSCTSDPPTRWLLASSTSSSSSSCAVTGLSMMGRPVLDAYKGDVYTNVDPMGQTGRCIPFDPTSNPSIAGFQSVGDPVDISSRFAVVTTRAL